MNDQRSGFLKTNLDVAKDKMWLVLENGKTIHFESTKLSKTTHGYSNDNNIFSDQTERFIPFSKHDIKVDTTMINTLIEARNDIFLLTMIFSFAGVATIQLYI
ncbi:hypothetical protein [Marinococcus luteus]|uniref:hypothetical protein n=1 Tax=Marinococcus luteus TaxID=1122204 RepID=UPI002ACC673B|nr:hypothetical protein [Marinococcus luteus]MDZ5783114.1 hypothetical protein [Marinococcus luteus]